MKNYGFCPAILEQLSSSSVISPRCQLISVDDEHGPIKKCLLTITTELPNEPVVSSVMISELRELSENSESTSMQNPEQVLSPTMLDFMVSNQNSPADGPSHELANDLHVVVTSSVVNKRKKVNAPLDVNDLRRSCRLAGLSVGFKNEVAANKAKNMKKCKKNLNA